MLKKRDGFCITFDVGFCKFRYFTWFFPHGSTTNSFFLPFRHSFWQHCTWFIPIKGTLRNRYRHCSQDKLDTAKKILLCLSETDSPSLFGSFKHSVWQFTQYMNIMLIIAANPENLQLRLKHYFFI